jgi:hypothetical protein
MRSGKRVERAFLANVLIADHTLTISDRLSGNPVFLTTISQFMRE